MNAMTQIAHRTFTTRSGVSARNLMFTLSIGLGFLVLSTATGCFSKQQRDESKTVTQQLNDQRMKTDNLRTAMVFLKQMQPTNSENISKQIQLELNAWVRETSTNNLAYVAPDWAMEGPGKLPSDLLELMGCSDPLKLEFNYWDIDYLYQCRMMRDVADWVTDQPIHDNLILPVIEAKQSQLEADEAAKLEDAYKLFDWSIRNIVLIDEGSSSVETVTQDARLPLLDSGVGYGYLPWQTVLFSRGDFIERGRVFSALAKQRGITTFWISVGAQPGEPGNLFTIGVLIGDEILLFDPKLGMPIMEPDAFRFATLKETLENDRVMRRLDLPGQFDYVLETSDLKNLQFLLDTPPVAFSARMKLLENSLLGDERMAIYQDVDAQRERLNKLMPDAASGGSIEVWQTPLLAQAQAASVKERLENPSQFTSRYMTMHGVWLLETPAAKGRLNHLRGLFENTLDERGALATYMESRIADELIQRLSYDPAVQAELGVRRFPGEPQEQYNARIAQAQYIFSQAKFDAAFLLAQLHFDRGSYPAAENWLTKRVLDDDRAAAWHSAGWYTLARTFEEQGKLEEAEEALTHQPSPQEPGNRLRLRYLKREQEN